MIPHKTTRGQQALRRLKVYEDIPARYSSQKTMVVPLAMRMLSLQRGRKYCDVGRLSHEVGWKYQHVVKEYEARRVEREAKRAKRLKIRHVSVNLGYYTSTCRLILFSVFLEIDQRSKQESKEGSRTIQSSIEGLWLLCTSFSMKCFYMTIKNNKYEMFIKLFYILSTSSHTESVN